MCVWVFAVHITAHIWTNSIRQALADSPCWAWLCHNLLPLGTNTHARSQHSVHLACPAKPELQECTHCCSCNVSVLQAWTWLAHLHEPQASPMPVWQGDMVQHLCLIPTATGKPQTTWLTEIFLHTSFQCWNYGLYSRHAVKCQKNRKSPTFLFLSKIYCFYITQRISTYLLHSSQASFTCLLSETLFPQYICYSKNGTHTLSGYLNVHLDIRSF